jgi:hypothetical protein
MNLVPTTVLLDRERELRFDYDAIDSLSSLPRVTRDGMSPLEIWGQANGFQTQAMAMMLWAGCRHADKNLTLDDMRRILRSALKGGRTTHKELNGKLNAAMNQSGVLGIFNPALSPDADDADEENPTPAPAMTPIASSSGDSRPHGE